jgi:hypothetical protein
MSSTDSVTVCITTFRRPERLAACIASAKAAGFENIVLCDGEEYGADLGCNNTWMVAAYRAKTKRVLLLHDDDTLHPDLGKVYESIVSVALDRGDAGFASWDAEIKYDDGHTEPCPYWQATVTEVILSKKLESHIRGPDCLTHSPVISILNRTVLIRACKEAAQTLITSDSCERPGMLLGTELLVYLRHCETFKRWLHVPQVLSYYGSHEGSGTVKAQLANAAHELIKGYNLARAQASCPAPLPSPRLILVHSVYEPKDEAERARQKIAQDSWRWHFANAEMIDLPYEAPTIPKIREVLDHACQYALPEDIVVYANADAGLTTHAVERIVAGVERGRGVTSCGNRNLKPEAGRLYKNLTNLKVPGGTEVVAMTPAWWRAHRERMPNMYIGREAWDTCFNALAEDWADGPGDVIVHPAEWLRSRAHTDNVCWHQDHYSTWQGDRIGLRSGVGDEQRFNRDAARAFFAARGDRRMLDLLK